MFSSFSSPFSSTTRAGLVARSAVALATAPLTLVLMSGTAMAGQSAQGAASSAASQGDAHASEKAAPHAVEAAPAVEVAVEAAPAAPDLTEPQPLSNADQNGTGANPGTTAGCGAYCSTRDGSASANGKGDGKAVGKPCAGCVGKADNKNPKGQAPSGPVDHNAGYECDRNQGIGKGNPAHTACTTPPGGGGGGEEECPDGTLPTGPDGACEPPGGGGGGEQECPDGTMPTGPDGACEAPGGGGGGEVLPPTFGEGTIVVPDVAPGSLPFTGDSTGALGLAALVLLASGGGLVLAGRRS